MPQISIARGVAHALLLAIEAGMGHSDDLLRDAPLMERMSDPDRRLATALVLGVLRWQIQLDHEIRKFLLKPKVKFDAEVLIALRLGVFQLLHLDRIPAHAAIDESVELVKRSGHRSAAGLVNAVLRKMANAAQEPNQNRESASSAASSVSGHEDSRSATRASALEANLPQAVAAHPAWMVERWKKFFGEENTATICAHDQSQPLPAIRLSSPDVEQELAAQGLGLSPGRVLSASRIVDSGHVIGTSAFRESRARLQDEGSQLVAEIAANAVADPKQILDCCAAPGGKTLILAERNSTAHIVACESSQARLKQLRDRLRSHGERVESKLQDATKLSFDSEFDLVLADVPCTGTGTLSRNPEIRHRLQPADLPRQAERQRAILASALRAVRPGGRVVYSTCSLEPEENEEVIQAVLGKANGARIVPLGTSLESLRDSGILIERAAESLQNALSPQGFLRLIPGALGTDGFFIAMLGKTG